MNEENNSVSTNNIPTPPNHLKIIYILLVLVSVLLIGIGFWSKSNNSATVSQTPQTANSKVQATPETIKSTLLQNAKLTIPAISTQQTISKKNLPSVLQKFILTGATQVVTIKTTYPDNTSGFWITYNLDKTTLLDVQQKILGLIPTQTGQILSGQRAELAGMIEFSLPQLKARMTYAQENPNTVSVLIQVLNTN